ncbi:MAG TPA: PLP-dependent aminotransferase family protein [Kofleriaceae bacterium]|jgi:GntR family transcriptional regulator/MocR family aminotransferase|nr:PLP-dependent aminotransferase family protein [Kofleriaceae bacterium]
MTRPPYIALHVAPGERRATAADIVASVQREIARGGLPAGSRLPPVRALERQLGLSKNTAQAAYDELVARGLVEAREREGVFVLAATRTDAPAPVAAPPLPALVPPPLSRQDFPGRGITALSTVFIDPELLPTERIAECARSVLRERMPAQYDAQGYRPLREAIARRLTARGLEVEPDEIVVTTGSQQSLDIVARSLTTKRIAVESPVYGYAKLLFESLGHELVGLHLDPFRGIDLDRWDRALARRPALAYLISSFQNPTGYSYTSAELRGVLELAERHGVAILEDDWGSDMLSDGEYRPMLRMLGGKRVLYVNSFTKKLLPSLRVGFVAAAPELVPTLVAMKRLSTLGNAWLTEAVVAEFLDRGYYDTHLQSVQRALDVRYAACLAALDELMPDGVRWTRPGGGPTLWLELPRTVGYAAIEAYLAERGVHVSNASAAYVGEPHLHGFRISYAYLPEHQMRAALTILAEGLRALMR